MEAYPNEPSGFASLYWGESLSSVKSRYTTDFLEYKGKDGASYMVTIPEVRGELGIKGNQSVMVLIEKEVRKVVISKLVDVSNTWYASFDDIHYHAMHYKPEDNAHVR